MLVQPSFSRTTPQSYEQIGHRVRALVCDPKVQRLQSVTVKRRHDESKIDWQRLVDEISETVGIHVDRLEEETIRIAWKGFCEA